MISVIVRSFNDEAVIRETLKSLLAQKIDEEVEILSFDSNSSDGTLDILREFPDVKIFPHDGLPYRPGRVLNRAVAAAKGDIVVFNNSDATPQDEYFLAALIRPLKDPAVGAVFANQLPRPDALPLVRKDYMRAFGDGRDAATWRHMFSLASSAARREVLVQIPFDEAYQYSEDIEWSWRLKTRHGMKIAYAPDARVMHSHNYTGAEVRKRFYNEGIADGMIWPEVPSLPRILLALGKEIVRDWLYLFRAREFGAILPGVVYRVRQRLYTYRGVCDQVKGRRK